MKKPIQFNNIASEDFRAVLLAESGFSNNYISEVTGLSHGMISYRTQQAKVRRKDYRDGTNHMAQRAIEKMNTLIGKTEQKVLGQQYTTLREKTLTEKREVSANARKIKSTKKTATKTK